MTTIIMVLAFLMSTAVTTARAQFSSASCPTGFANFGDSLTDTGNAINAFPLFLNVENAPYGSSFFGKPAKRFTNGRVVPDFFSQAFKVQLLEPYFSVATFNYANGVNLANAGAAAAFAPNQTNPFTLTPFQTAQFLRFQKSVNSARSQSGCGLFNMNLPGGLFPPSFSNWLYTIEAGGNDLLPPLETGVPFSVVNTTIVPKAVLAVSTAITFLYKISGAKQFLVFGIPAAGCSTVILTSLLNQPTLEKDSLGCLVGVNSVVHNFNTQLQQQIALLRLILPGVNIAYFDYYAANVEILENPATYGFNPNLTMTACCGAPGVGPWNFNPAVMCGLSGSSNCSNPDQYVIWDGIHFTENYYRQIAKFALTGKFTDGGPDYSSICNLDFSQFGSEATFSQAYSLLGLTGASTPCNGLFTRR